MRCSGCDLKNPPGAKCRVGRVDEGTAEMGRIFAEIEAEGFPAPSEFSPQYRLAMLYGAGHDPAEGLNRVTVALETLGRFTEGFDTVDQKDAKALLEELTAQRTEAARAARPAKHKLTSG